MPKPAPFVPCLPPYRPPTPPLSPLPSPPLHRRNVEAYALFDNSVFELPMDIWEQVGAAAVVHAWGNAASHCRNACRLPQCSFGAVKSSSAACRPSGICCQPAVVRVARRSVCARPPPSARLCSPRAWRCARCTSWRSSAPRSTPGSACRPATSWCAGSSGGQAGSGGSGGGAWVCQGAECVLRPASCVLRSLAPWPPLPPARKATQRPCACAVSRRPLSPPRSGAARAHQHRHRTPAGASGGRLPPRLLHGLRQHAPRARLAAPAGPQGGRQACGGGGGRRVCRRGAGRLGGAARQR